MRLRRGASCGPMSTWFATRSDAELYELARFVTRVSTTSDKGAPGRPRKLRWVASSDACPLSLGNFVTHVVLTRPWSARTRPRDRRDRTGAVRRGLVRAAPRRRSNSGRDPYPGPEAPVASPPPRRLRGRADGPRSARTREAALLACGRGAIVSHRSAAQLWRIVDPDEAEAVSVDVTVRRGEGRSRAGLTVHRTRHLARADVRIIEGSP
jgi:hypothetical protein